MATGSTEPELDLARGLATWRALGTYVHLCVLEPGAVRAASDLAVAILEEVDLSCSRFRPDSDLSRVNRAGGRHTVSPVLVGAVRLALEAAHDTGGLVDPTLGEVLHAAGYDRTFAQVPAVTSDPAHPPAPRAGWRQIDVIDDHTLDVPDHLGLDLGATGKAYAADLVATMVGEALGTSVLVSIGGDVATDGAEPEAGWLVHVAPTMSSLASGAVTATVSLPAGLAMATSSVATRRWQRSSTGWHHLIDPRTGQPARGPWTSVTALGRSCTAANAATTAAMVVGDDAPAWLEDRAVPALLLAENGAIVRTSAWSSLGVETIAAVPA